jgi:type VI secretion system protein ImpL
VAPAKGAARLLAGKFAVDTAAAPVAPAVRQLLLAPIEGAEAALRAPAAVRPPRVAAKPAGGGGAPPPPVLKPADVAVLNERGKALCADLAPVLAKFPFSPDAQPEASLAEVKDLLAPGKGKLWVFQQDRLTGLLDKQGADWVARPGATVPLSQGFVDFFNRAAHVSAALFPNDGPDPHVELTVRGLVGGEVRDLTLRQGDQTAHFGPGATSPAQLTWPSQSGREATLSVRLNRSLRGDKDVTIAHETGEWALFRLFARAAKVQGGRAEWAGRGGAGTVAITYTSPNGTAVLERNWLGSIGCNPQVTR